MTKLNRALIEFKSLPSIVCLLFYCLPYQRLAASHQVSPLNEAHLIIGGFPVLDTF